MKRFLCDFEIESHGCLAESEKVIKSTLPTSDVEIHFKNHSVDPGVDRPLLSVQVILSSESLEAARAESKSFLKGYLDYLCFVANLPLRIHKQIRVVDWTPGLKERECHQFERFPGSQLPYPVLQDDIFESVKSLLQVNVSPVLLRAMKWFSAGVNGEYSDVQFQFFWLAIELVAQLNKNIEPVNDKCPKCQKPLYCHDCDDYPKHRPYQKQAIKQLFDRTFTKGSEELFDISNIIRNAIAHGDDLTAIEIERNFLVSDIVNHLGQFAWTALLNEFLKTPEAREVVGKLNFLQPNMYSNKTLSITAHLLVYSSDPDHPKLSEVAKPEVSLVFPEKTNGKKP